MPEGGNLRSTYTEMRSQSETVVAIQNINLKKRSSS